MDDDGIISLNFECDQMAPNSEFTWSKDYVPTEDSPRLEVESKGNKYVLFQSYFSREEDEVSCLLSISKKRRKSQIFYIW